MTVRREILSHVGRSVGSGVPVGVGVVGLVVTGGTYVGGAGVNCNNSVMEVTVQTCGDLRVIRPLAERQSSTEFALQIAPVPSNVNSYSWRYWVSAGLALTGA